MPKRPIRVLILDDDQAFGGMIRDYLDITTDCQIDVIETDSQLWPLLSENSYDLMFLDYQLKQTTGLEVLAQIKEQRYQIPIVMMTGQGSEKVASDAFKLGAMEYLVKGDFPFALLPELVRKAVRSQRMQRAMRRSLDKIRYQATLLDNVRDALVVWDSRGHITYWNRTAEELYRKLSGDVLGRTAEHAYFSLFSPPMRLADLTGEPRQINERRLAHPDSQETWISSIISPLRDESGQAIGFMDVTRDITHIKQIETRIQLRLAGEQLLAGVSSLFISTPASEEEPVFCEVIERVVGFIGAQTGALLVNHNGTLRCLCVVANQRGDRRVSNCSFDLNDPQYAPLRDYADRRELTFIPGLQALGSFGDELRTNLSTDEQSLILLPLLVRDRLIGMLFLGFPPNQVQWEEEHRHLLVTFGSILASVLLQIRTDQDLVASEARYRAIVDEHQTEMICRFRMDGALTFINEAYARYYGAMRGGNFLATVIEEDRAPVVELLNSLSTEKPVGEVTHRVLIAGKERWLTWIIRRVEHLPGENTEISAFQAVGRDVTERLVMEAEVRSAQQRLSESARLSSVGRLAASVAHQISNPLTTVIAEGQMLLHDLNPGLEAYVSAEAIVRAGWRAQQVVDSLMKFSASADEERTLVSVGDTIEQALILCSAQYQAELINLVINLPETPVRVMGFRQQLIDLWINFLLAAPSLTNAPAPKRLHINATLSQNGYIMLQVLVEGIPSDPDLSTIFDPTLIPTADSSSNGMEMTICREIIRRHQGSITVSTDGDFTCFEILLPSGGEA